MPVLQAEDGTPLDVTPDTAKIDQDFARAMADDGPDTQAPPRRQPKPPDSPDTPRPRRGRPPKAEQARVTAAAAIDDSQRAQNVKGLAQLSAGIFLLLGKATGKDAYKADAVTIASAAGDIADACVQTAQADPKFGAALDRVCAAGPYAALITVAVGVGSQIARNHKPALIIPGTVDPAGLLKAQDEMEAASA